LPFFCEDSDWLGRDVGRGGFGTGVAVSNGAVPAINKSIARFGEELGWTGYALDPLQARCGALGAAVVLGTASAAFHLVPLVIDGHPPAWIAWHLAHMVPYRVVLVWSYNVTGRSMFAVVAFHSTSNIGEVVWPFYLGEGYDPFVTASS
jgi:hypothetical protein